MAQLKKEHTTMTQSILQQTIFFLRPISEKAIEVLNAIENDSYPFELAPPNKPTDQLSGEVSDEDFASPVESEEHIQTHNPPNSAPTGSSRDAYQPHPFVLRFGFDSVENPSKKGFTFGDTPECQVQLLTKDAQRYFSIRYNFNSGALLIRAHMPIQVGAKKLKRSQSLVLMPDMEITLRHLPIMFSVEFPDISHCVELHKESYRRYCMRCGLNNASYMQTITEDHELIAGHRCLSPIGRGGFGTVYEAINMSSGRKVALKHILGNASIMKEVEILRELRHNNIITLYSYKETGPGKLCIVMELAVNGLDAHIKATQNQYLSLDCIRSIARQALSGLDYLHGKTVIHRDLKPSNILVTKWDQITDTLEIKLADFGLASKESEPDTYCGTEGYLAPELEYGKMRTNRKLLNPYTTAVDIWAMGKILSEFVLERDEYLGGEGHRSRAAAPALRLTEQMMSTNPDQRPTAAQCLEYPWLRPKESFSKPVAPKRKASPDATNHRAKGPRLGSKPTVD